MSGRDVIGIAKTGSGKTLGFLLPMFRHVMDQRELDNGEGPIGLVFNFFFSIFVYIIDPCLFHSLFSYIWQKNGQKVKKKRDCSYKLLKLNFLKLIIKPTTF